MGTFKLIFSIVSLIVASAWPAMQKQYRRSLAVFGGKHLARYGTFLDQIQKPRNLKMETLYSKLNISNGEFQNGVDLRKSRIRDQVEMEKVFRDTTVVIPEKDIQKTEEEIDIIVETLNACLEGKSMSELSFQQRAGVIDWVLFDNHAHEVIVGYDDEKTRKRLKSWVKFHVSKGDVVFQDALWKWDSSRIKKFGRKKTILIPKE